MELGEPHKEGNATVVWPLRRMLTSGYSLVDGRPRSASPAEHGAQEGRFLKDCFCSSPSPKPANANPVKWELHFGTDWSPSASHAAAFCIIGNFRDVCYIEHVVIMKS